MGSPDGSSLGLEAQGLGEGWLEGFRVRVRGYGLFGA